MSLTMEALLQKPDFVKEVILSEKAYKNSQLDHLLDLCEKHNIKIVYDDKTIDKLSIKENCYCIGVFDKFYFKPEGRRHIVLYGFNDYGELGTVLRSSIAFDFHDIILVNSQIDYFDPRCIRASMGSIFHTNISQYDDLNSYLNTHKDYEIYPFVSESDRKLSTLKLHDPRIRICWMVYLITASASNRTQKKRCRCPSVLRSSCHMPMIEIADGSCIFCIVQAKSFFAGSLLYNLYISSNQGWPPGFPFLNRRLSYVLWDPDSIIRLFLHG